MQRDRTPNSKRLLSLYYAAYWMCKKRGFHEYASDCAQYVIVKVLEGCEWSSTRQLVTAYLREEFGYRQSEICPQKVQFLRNSRPGKIDRTQSLSDKPFEAFELWLDLVRLPESELDKRAVHPHPQAGPRISHCVRGHELTYDNVCINQSGARAGRMLCRTCKDAMRKKFRAKRFANYKQMEFVYYDAFNDRLIVAPHTHREHLYLSEL